MRAYLRAAAQAGRPAEAAGDEAAGEREEEEEEEAREAEQVSGQAGKGGLES